MDAINKELGKLKLFEWKGTYPIGIGSLSLFSLGFEIAVTAGPKINKAKFVDFMNATIFQDTSYWESTEFLDIFADIISFVDIVPALVMKAKVEGLDTSKSSLLKYLLAAYGLDLKALRRCCENAKGNLEYIIDVIKEMEK